MNLLPVLNNVLVHMRPDIQETKSGIVIPPIAQRLTLTGDVLAVGPDCKYVAVGNIVLVDKHTGTFIRWEKNTQVLMVKEDKIQAIFDGDINDNE